MGVVSITGSLWRRSRHSSRPPSDDSLCAVLVPRGQCCHGASRTLTSCCRLQPRAPARCRTDWHRSRAPAPTRWWRRPSSAPRPSGRAPCPRLLLGGPPVCLQVRGPLARKWAVQLRSDTAGRRRRGRKEEGGREFCC